MLLPFGSCVKGYTKKRGSGPYKGPSLAGSTTILLPLLPGAPLSLIQAAPVVGEHGVQELRVGVHRLLGESLGGFLLLALLLDQILRQGPVALGLGPEVVDDAVEEVLRQLRVELLGRNRAVGEGLIGFLDCLGELLGRLVYLLLLSLVHPTRPPESWYFERSLPSRVCSYTKRLASLLSGG